MRHRETTLRDRTPVRVPDDIQGADQADNARHCPPPADLLALYRAGEISATRALEMARATREAQ